MVEELDPRKTLAPERAAEQEPDAWHVLVWGLPLAGDVFQVGPSIVIRKLVKRLSVFDLAALGAVGFREWATLDPMAPLATAEIESKTADVSLPGYDALNKCWLVSALLVLRGFVAHLCPACSGYSWNLVAGHVEQTRHVFREQLAEEGVEKAVYEPRASLPKFKGNLLDYHLKLIVPKKIRKDPFDSSDAEWLSENFEVFNRLCAEDERFRFALEAAVDWRFAKDLRSAISRLWAGIECMLNVTSELVFRIALMSSTIIAERGPDRLEAFKKIKRLYALRSKAVHGEPLTEDKLSLAMEESLDLLRRILIDAGERGAVRTENDYNEEIFC